MEAQSVDKGIGEYIVESNDQSSNTNSDFILLLLEQQAVALEKKAQALLAGIK